MINKQIYSEVYAALLALGEEYTNHIPSEVFSFIKNHSDVDCIPQIDETKGLSGQNLLEESIAMLAMLRLEYLCDSEEEKEEFLTYLQTNEEKIKETLMSTPSTRELLRLVKK